ncbi:hypothetical protein PCANC_27038 [Puccinia coronata f. sp. avenae]|uniref:Uncharacterized protein n=1 Tax=Puccinia coronata f. sp. avenae TaxID=200324 RepID=A0A2N5T9I5_9BASI|nr:hypothetical protein PCANC_27038 [Puccinia coronata f. sp. avenae]
MYTLLLKQPPTEEVAELTQHFLNQQCKQLKRIQLNSQPQLTLTTRRSIATHCYTKTHYHPPQCEPDCHLAKPAKLLLMVIQLIDHQLNENIS